MKIAVGMSGGVDSAVSALLLKTQGHEVIGLFMKNWEEDPCPASQDLADVANICSQIGISYYTINFTHEYRERVFERFLADCRSGLTPNPDVLCNSEMKFDLFLEKALSLGVDKVATGHYCQIGPNNTLLRGHDPQKDQSYFLHAIEPSALSQTLFPIGHLPKKEVRKLAQEAGLCVATKRDSTGICFIGKRNFKTFLSQFLGFQKGVFQTLSGKVVGEHDGVAYYTIGQRKGIGLGGPGDAWYVVGKDPAHNLVFVEQGANHPALYQKTLFANQLRWISKTPSLPDRCTAKIRYRQHDSSCMITEADSDQILVTFDEPQRAITPGQAVVFYQDEVCLGGGTILPSRS